MKKCEHMPYVELFLIGGTHLAGGYSQPWRPLHKKLSNQSNLRFDLCEKKINIRTSNRSSNLAREIYVVERFIREKFIADPDRVHEEIGLGVRTS